MTDTTVVDQSGITRTADGTIADQTSTTQTDQSKATTTPETTKTESSTTSADGKTLLTEGKTETKVEDKSKTDDKSKTETKSTAPEKYADYKVPEGFKIDPAIKTEADALFKDFGLTQDQAQKSIDLYTKLTSDAAKAPYEAYQKLTDDWRKEAESHPDLKGKLGPGQEVNLRIAKALDSLGDPALTTSFKELMDLTGAGNHPAFIRVINELSKTRVEGTHVSGNGPSKGGQSAPGQAPPGAAAALWPTLPSSSQG